VRVVGAPPLVSACFKPWLSVPLKGPQCGFESHRGHLVVTMDNGRWSTGARAALGDRTGGAAAGGRRCCLRPDCTSSIPGGLLVSINHTQVRFVDEIISRMPAVTDTERLVLPTVTPLAEVIRIGYALDRTPLHVMVTVYEVG
jgi:hypothetical protein